MRAVYLAGERELDAHAGFLGHPVERELARLFDEHGIAWEYEPHTFVLECDADGTVREGFTPDFFLSEVGVYLECTVMRPELANRKRRPARRTRERTGATVEIVSGRDFDRLARRWGSRRWPPQPPRARARMFRSPRRRVPKPGR